ncbi:MAG: NAD(P)/FAD-dependent oxidoreductase [Nonlabens sp.]
MISNYDTIIVGGGAAGFFAALNLAEQQPNHRIAILERGKDVLQKVRISGGGRCNVTHAQFDPRELSQNYPRGERELLGPFHNFMTGDTIGWFEERGVALKIEEDGRMFPESNTSSTIVDCFLTMAQRHKVEICKQHNVDAIIKDGDRWELETSKGIYTCRNLVVTTGSSPKVWKMLSQLGHKITTAVPSLFTFNVVEKDITQLAGIAQECRLELPGLQLESQGPLLITHWGFSGPAILRLSAWGARELNAANYQFDMIINWLNDQEGQDCLAILKMVRESSKKLVINDNPFELPKRLWQHLVSSTIDAGSIWAECSNKVLELLATTLTASVYSIDGKSTFKEEFVTAGGVDLKEINFKSFESRLHPGLYLAGEVLNIDAITGGFNFQNAWTGGWIIARTIASRAQSI